MGNQQWATNKLGLRSAELFVLKTFYDRNANRRIVIHTASVHILLIDGGKIALDKRGKPRYNSTNASALRRWGAVPKSFGSKVQFFDATESLGCMRSARARPDSFGTTERDIPPR